MPGRKAVDPVGGDRTEVSKRRKELRMIVRPGAGADYVLNFDLIGSDEIDSVPGVMRSGSGDWLVKDTGNLQLAALCVQAAVFTREIDTGMSVAAELDASAVMINDHTAFAPTGCPLQVDGSQATVLAEFPTPCMT